MKTITRADVAEAIYEEIGLSRKEKSFKNWPEVMMSSCLHLEHFLCVTNVHVPVAIPRPVLRL